MSRDTQIPVGARPTRHDLDLLEFDAVRELLRERLPTALGRHLVDAMVPYPDLAAGTRRLAQIESLAQRLRTGDRVPIGGAVEVRSWLAGFFLGEHQPQTRDIADLKRLLRAADQCRGWLGRDQSDEPLRAFAATFPPLSDLVAELEAVVDDRGEVLDTASVRIADARAEIRVAEAAVRTAIARFLADDGVRRCLQSLEPAWRNGRPVFGVKQEMRGRVEGVLHDRSQTGATVFIEPSIVVEAANRLSDAQAVENHEIQVVLTQTCRGLRRNRIDVEGAVDAMSDLDVAVGSARLVVDDGFVVAPLRAAGSPLRLNGAVHPLLLRTTTDRNTLVELEIELGETYRMLVVTGPNTGGKTVALKTIGLLSVMAMCGLPIPARSGSEVPFFDGVFVDIGDAQGISQNLSTFSSHVTRIVRVLREATAHTLVLLDELGAGTDPEEGGALGYAVLEAIAARRSLAVVTTHVGRLKVFADQHQEAENGAMAFDGGTLRPLYRLDVGIPGTSHALDIARRVGVPGDLIERARELMGVRDDRLEEQIQRVQVARRAAELERQRRVELSREVEAAGTRLEDEQRAIEHRRAWLHEEADALVDEELRAARSLLEGPLRELVNGPRGFGERAKQLLDSLQSLLVGTSVHRRRMRFLGALKKDGFVWVPSLGKRCVVRKIDRVRELLTVEVGRMRIEIPFEDASWLQPLE